MLQRLPIAFAKVEADNTSEKLLNEVRHNIFFASKKNILKTYIIEKLLNEVLHNIFFVSRKKNTKNVYNNIMNSVQL